MARIYPSAAETASSGRLTPFGEGVQRVDVVVDHVGMRIFLPAAGRRILRQVARAAQLVDRVEREREGLMRLLGEAARSGRPRIQGEHRTIGRVDAAPGLM